MSSVLNVPEVLALAISLAAAPAAPGVSDVHQAAMVRSDNALRSFAAFRRTQAVHWSDFRFSGQNWFAAVAQAGDVPGYGKYAARIFKTRSGRYYVPLAGERRTISLLRRNARAAFLMTANKMVLASAALAEKLQRRPLPAELYMARRFGVAPAARFIELAQKRPKLLAATRFAKLAFDHTGLFFGRRQARSAGEVYAMVSHAFDRAARRALRAARVPEGGQPRMALVREAATRESALAKRNVVAALSWRASINKPQ